MAGFELPPPPPTQSNPGHNQWDLGVVVAFGYMLPPDLIASFPMSMINAHGSLLPKFKGAAPMQYSIITGEKEAGVSITALHPTRIDAGRVMTRHPVALTAQSTYSSIAPILSEKSAAAMVDVLKNWDLRMQESVEQSVLEQRLGTPPAEKLRCPKIRPPFCFVNFRKTAEETSCLVRGLHGFESAFASFQGKRVFFEDIAVVKIFENEKEMAEDKPTEVDGVPDYEKTVLSNLKRDPNVDYSLPGVVCYDRVNKCVVITCADKTYIKVR